MRGGVTQEIAGTGSNLIATADREGTNKVQIYINARRLALSIAPKVLCSARASVVAYSA